MTQEWVRQWPGKPGMFWLHGWLYTEQQLQPPATYLVNVHIQHGAIVCSTSGVVLRDADGCRGVWAVADIPKPQAGRL